MNHSYLMQKRKINICILLMGIGLLFISCKGDKSENINDTGITGTTSSNAISESTISQDAFEEATQEEVIKELDSDEQPSSPDIVHTSADYEIKEKIYSVIEDESKINVMIKYPQISGRENEEEVNDLLFNEITHKFLEYIEDSRFREEGFIAKINYKVMYQGNEVLSVYLNGFYDMERSPRSERDSFAVNINLNTIEVISLEDVLEREEIKRMLYSNKFMLIDGTVDTFEEKGSQYYWENYDDYYSGAEYVDYLAREHNYDFYLKDGVIGIIVEVEHSEGGYASLEGEYHWSYPN